MRSGRPSTVTCVQIKEPIDQCNRDNRISTDEGAPEMGISHGKLGARII